ncbi:hypothetical protein G6F37_007595 [Rhizopus arrhizus]|nr:hypothetical protein G6F38_000640 [Rhizopus arrhizus]KAG1156452.1 hypothetical protein G6F37_007595 [Rhizopus arrhizus]
MSYSSIDERTDDSWRRPSVLSSSSIATSSSGGEDSFQSFDTFAFEKDFYQSTPSGIELNTNTTSHYSQLIDDLGIIDDIYHYFNDENEAESYERQMADTARNVSQKQYTVEKICQSEEQLVQDLIAFHQVYLVHLQRWTQEPNNSDLFTKYPQLCSQIALDDLIDQVLSLIRIHRQFLNDFKERLEIWGPTQFISDVFSSLFENLSAYEPFLNSYPSTIVSINTLYSKSSSFIKFLESCMFKSDKPVRDLLYYLKIPLQRVSSYASALSCIVSVTEPSHPDYRALIRIEGKFRYHEKKRKNLIKDRLAHIRALEASRSVLSSPATVTSTRRLYITGLLTRVDLSDPQSFNDTRTYLLYNDYFFYCQKTKPFNKKSTIQKLQYKGLINLRNAEISPLSSQVIAKITEIKKPSVLTAAFKRGKNTERAPVVTAVYGFQLATHEVSVENSSGTVLPGSMPGNGIAPPQVNLGKQQFIMRTQTEAEQKAWMSLIEKVIHHLSTKKA